MIKAILILADPWQPLRAVEIEPSELDHHQAADLDSPPCSLHVIGEGDINPHAMMIRRVHLAPYTHVPVFGDAYLTGRDKTDIPADLRAVFIDKAPVDVAVDGDVFWRRDAPPIDDIWVAYLVAIDIINEVQSGEGECKNATTVRVVPV